MLEFGPFDRCCQSSMINEILAEIHLKQNAERRQQPSCLSRRLWCSLVAGCLVSIYHVYFPFVGGAGHMSYWLSSHWIVIIEKWFSLHWYKHKTKFGLWNEFRSPRRWIMHKDTTRSPVSWYPCALSSSIGERSEFAPRTKGGFIKISWCCPF